MKTFVHDQTGLQKLLKNNEAFLIRRDCVFFLEEKDMIFFKEAIAEAFKKEIKIDAKNHPYVKWFINGEEIK